MLLQYQVLILFRFLLTVWVSFNTLHYHSVVSLHILHTLVQYMPHAHRLLDVALVGQWRKEEPQVNIIKLVVNQRAPELRT